MTYSIDIMQEMRENTPMSERKHIFSENEKIALTPEARLAAILLESAALRILNDTTSPEYAAAYRKYNEMCLRLTTDLGLAEKFILTKEPGEEFDRESAQKPGKALMGTPHWFGVIAREVTMTPKYWTLK